MPKTGRRRRCSSSEDENAVKYYSKHRCIDREYSPVGESRHIKHYSSGSHSRERRRRNHLYSRNRSRSNRRSDRRLRRHKYHEDSCDGSTVGQRCFNAVYLRTVFYPPLLLRTCSHFASIMSVEYLCRDQSDIPSRFRQLCIR